MYAAQLLEHVANPQHDVPHETSYEIPHEIKESAKLTSDWIRLAEHQAGTNHISDALRKNTMLHGGIMPMHSSSEHKIDAPHHSRMRRFKRGGRIRSVAREPHRRVLMDHYDEIQVEPKGKHCTDKATYR